MNPANGTLSNREYKIENINFSAILNIHRFPVCSPDAIEVSVHHLRRLLRLAPSTKKLSLQFERGFPVGNMRNSEKRRGEKRQERKKLKEKNEPLVTGRKIL